MATASARRLGRLAEHLPLAGAEGRVAAEVSPASALAPALAPTPTAPAPLPNDDALAAFVKRGFVELPMADIAPAVHARLHREAEGVWRRSGELFGAGLGNNVAPALDVVDEVVEAPSVQAALRTILGERFALYSHRFMHHSGTYEQGPQSWHSAPQAPAKNAPGRQAPKGWAVGQEKTIS